MSMNSRTQRLNKQPWTRRQQNARLQSVLCLAIALVLVAQKAHAGFDILHEFGRGDIGATPVGELAVADGRLFGGTYYSLTPEVDGTLFSVMLDGTDFRTLHSFRAETDGSQPFGGLIVEGSTIYGTASAGSARRANGTVFRMQTDGSGFELLHLFNGHD